MNKIWILLLTTLFLSACNPIIEELLPSGVTQTENNNYFSFEPETEASTGIIFYPGAPVDAESYTSWLNDLAEKGYLTISVKMPLNLAVLDINAALRIQNKFPNIENWVIGGHSLGGAMAIQLLDKPIPADRFEALLLLGAYPGATTDISDWSGKVLSLSASEDLISSPDEIEEGKSRLPDGVDLNSFAQIDNEDQAVYHEIQGGNHAQFGNYGLQNDDGIATISPEAQQELIVAWTDAFLEINGW